MHDIRFIREHPEAFDRALNRRNLSEQEKHDFSSQNLLSIDGHHRAIIRTLEGWQARHNAASKVIGQAKAKGDVAKVEELMAEVAESKVSISNLEREEKDAGKRLEKLLEQIPNLPLDDVPDGKDPSDNVELRHFGAKRNYAFVPKQHFDLGEALGQMDFEIAAKLSGARFVVLKKGLARLERALGQLMLDVHTSDPHNYVEVSPPLLVRDEAMLGTGQLPKFRYDQYFSTSAETFAGIEDIVSETFDAAEAKPQTYKSYIRHIVEDYRRYLGRGASSQEKYIEQVNRLVRNMYVHGFSPEAIEGARVRALAKLPNAVVLQFRSPKDEPKKERFWLIPTAEVPLTNLVRESILDEAQLPMRFTAGTPCFRAEAGAAGKDTRGMIRQHQFNKVELVSITTSEQSKDEHERMLSCAEEVLKRLELHYRVMTLSTGDMGFASQKTYDIEVWLPGQGAYREISSCSNCGEFQARRMNARYRTKEGRQVRHVHTLNGSGVAVGRALIAVMETYQQEDGAIAVPEALGPYMGGIKKIASSE
jgi:seryl-tRNA synthetase